MFIKVIKPNKLSSFTLIELLIVIAILSTLTTVTVLILNPAQILTEFRDTTRLNDIKTLNNAIAINSTLENSIGTDPSPANKVYISLPNTSGNADDPCTNYLAQLPPIKSGWEYRCRATTANLKSTNGTGWIPINFSAVPNMRSQLNVLPTDPVNIVTNFNYYTYSRNSEVTKYALTMKPESNKHIQTAINDGGIDNDLYETEPIAWRAEIVSPGFERTTYNWIYEEIDVGRTYSGTYATDWKTEANQSYSLYIASGGSGIGSNLVKQKVDLTNVTSLTYDAKFQSWAPVDTINNCMLGGVFIDGVKLKEYFNLTNQNISYTNEIINTSSYTGIHLLEIKLFDADLCNFASMPVPYWRFHTDNWRIN